MYLRNAEDFSPHITKLIGSANRKSAKCHICGRSASLTNYLTPQICGTYLRTTHHLLVVHSLYDMCRILKQFGVAYSRCRMGTISQ
jgi:hypothetical protein